MKKFTNRIVVLLFIISLISTAAHAQTLIPGGQVIGLELGDGRVRIADFATETPQKAGLQIGDEITHINQTPVGSAAAIRQVLRQANTPVEVGFLRNGKQMTVRLCPTITDDGPRLGIYLKPGVTGVGTISWYDPQTGKFGALGHCVNDSGGQPLAMENGQAYRAGILCVKKGKAGAPGQLMGSVDPAESFGSLYKNASQGVFGNTSQTIPGQPLPVAEASQVKTGPATIRSTVTADSVQEYSVNILKIYPAQRSGGRNMLIKVTDPALLETTGGIVQGMSGSPIIQDGKLVGAVTHVLVNDPTTGYGIFIENMLDAAA